MQKLSHFIIALTLISPMVYPFQFVSAQSVKDGDIVLADNISGTLVKMQDDAGALFSRLQLTTKEKGSRGRLKKGRLFYLAPWCWINSTEKKG